MSSDTLDEALESVGPASVATVLGAIVSAMLRLGSSPEQIGEEFRRYATSVVTVLSSPEFARNLASQDQLMRRSMDAFGLSAEDDPEDEDYGP